MISSLTPSTSLCLVLALAASLATPLTAVAEPATAAASDARSLRMAQVEKARLSRDLDALTALVPSLEAAIAAATSDADAAAAHYDLAYLCWRATYLARPGASPSRSDWVARAQQQVEKARSKSPDDSEVRILEGAITGARAGESAFARLRLGRRAYELTQENARLFPDNPRALIQKAIVLFHAPGFAGGGPESALEVVRPAYDAFQRGAGQAAWPSWGENDSAAWLGQSLAGLDRPAEARAVYERELERAPHALWVRNTLLPELGSQGDVAAE